MLTAEWPTSRLGDVCEIFDGPHATPHKTDSGPLFLGIECLNKGRLRLGDAAHLSEHDYVRWTRRVTPRIGDLVFSYETRLGEAALIPDGLKCCLGRRMGLLRIKDGRADPRFLLYAFLAPEFQDVIRRRTVHGSTVDRILLTEMPTFPIACPQLDVQRPIGAALGAFDDRIELSSRTSARLEELARALFASWFGNLDPDRVPAGWTVASLGDHVDVTRGLSYTGAGLAYGGLPLHNLDSIADVGGYRYEGIKYYRGDHRPRHVVKSGDLLVVNTDLTWAFQRIAQPALVPQRFGELSLFSHHLYRVKPKSGSWLTGRFLYLALISNRLRQVVVGYSNGTTVNMLPADALQRPRLAVPPADLVWRFDQVVQPLFAKQEQLQLESETLAKLRDLLLPKLMSGEIRLKEAEKAVAEAG